MAQMGYIIINVIGPIFLVIGLSALIGRRMNPDPRTLSTFLVYLFIPALVFRGFATMDLRGDSIAGVAGVAFIMPILMMLIGVAITRLRRWPPPRQSAFILCLFMVNAANYGIPFNVFAFGPQAESLALLYYAVQMIPSNIMGIYFASRGAMTARDAVLNVLRTPLTYAAAAGLLVNVGAIQLPLPVMRAMVDIAAEASIPCMLALLGLKLAQTKLHGLWRPVLLATGFRLLVAPLIALSLALLLGLAGLPFQVVVMQSAMPTAVLAGAFTTEFGSDSDFASAVIFISTLLSVVTLSVILVMVAAL